MVAADTNNVPRRTGDGDPAELNIELQAEFERARAVLGLLEAEPGPVRLGRFEIRAVLGRGGMGVVYEAHDPQLQRSVALKIVRSQPFIDAQRLQARLQREARALAQLNHPNVVSVYEIGEHDGQLFVAMEHVDGENLRGWQSQEGRPPEEILRAYVESGRGLAAAHAAGIVHRDFKPDNVFVADDGRVRVGDFGLAYPDVGLGPDDDLEASVDARVTQTGALLGTLGYMAPEQLRGDPATVASDQFAFCVALWEGIEGVRPFVGDTREALLDAMDGPLPSTSKLDQRIRDALACGLSVEPDARHRDMLALLATLEAEPGGPGRWIGGALLGVTIAALAGLSMVWNDPTPPLRECELASSLQELQHLPRLVEARAALVEIGADAECDRLDRHLEHLRRSVEALCDAAPTDDVLARRQHVAFLIAELRELPLSTAPADLEQLAADIWGLDDAWTSSAPARPLDPNFMATLQRSRALEHRNQLAEAAALLDDWIAHHPHDTLELAAAQLRRGRLHALSGERAKALDAYTWAATYAEPSAYDDVRLSAALLSAKTTLMRTEDLELGRRQLALARGIMLRHSEPLSSWRWAEYHELAASYEKRAGHFNRALLHQSIALARYIVGDLRYEAGIAHLNFGTIFEWQSALEGRPDEAARRHYEIALDLLDGPVPSPGQLQAKTTLAQWLVQRDAESDIRRACELFAEVAEQSVERRITALSGMILCREVLGEEVVWVAEALSRELERRPPDSPRKHVEVEQALALAWASAGRWDELTRAARRAEVAASTWRANAADPALVDLFVAGFALSIFTVAADSQPELAATYLDLAANTMSRIPAAKRQADLVSAIENELGADLPTPAD